MKNPYTENRRRPDKAASYDTKYERQLHKRVSNWREKRLLGALLEETGRHARLLDVPSGAGRLSGLFADRAENVYEVDHSREMLKLCRGNASGYEPRLTEASVFHLPFEDGAFDLVVSIRLSHHIQAREARLDHLRELFRASRRYVLVTFFGEESLKNRMRNFWRKLGSGKRAKYTLSLREVEALAKEHRFRIVRARQLSAVFSGHVFTLLERSL